MARDTDREVIVAYSGVHQAFQVAQAADHAALLNTFYGSVFDAPGKWGRFLGRILGEETLFNRRCPGPDAARLREIPRPFLLHRLLSISRTTRRWYPWYQANFDFDRRVASHLPTSGGRLLVGTETCARDSFRAATKLGMIKVLDCPQVHPDFLTQVLAKAADDLGVDPPVPFDPPVLAARKAEEFASADVMLMISEMHRKSFIDAGFAAERLVVIPWWMDAQLWFPPAIREREQKTALKALFVGKIDFRKGIPYLVQALEKCGDAVRLTLVGENSHEVTGFLDRSSMSIHYAGRKTKAALRKIYWESDVLVLPSLIDTFGLVALEAMACGLPVIVTENCGVPVPDPSWRVPVMDSDALARRLHYYVQDRDALVRDGQTARQFALQFSPELHRQQITDLLKSLLQRS